MKCYAENVICVGIREPREYEFNGRKGTSYAVEITDGNGAVELPVNGEDVFCAFELMEKYNVELEFSMVAQSTGNGNARNFPRVRISSAVKA